MVTKKKIKFTLKTIWGTVLYESDVATSVSEAVVEANLREANLYEANLYEANLRGANLYGADLRGADLRGAKNIPDDKTDFWWHVHHETLVEQLYEPLRARINYIKKDKPKDEIEVRLKLLKPVLGKIPTTQRGWEALHKKECGCGWNGKTIFTKKNGLAK